MTPYYDRAGIIIWHGDCLEVLPELSMQNPVLITDPPYEIKGKFGESDLYGKRTMQFDFDAEGITERVVLPALKIAFSLVCSFHVFCECEQYGKIAGLARESGLTPKPFARLKACPPPPMPGNWWPNGFELAMYGYRPKAWFGDKSGKRVNVYKCDSYRHGIRSDEKEEHPTQKWLPMISYIASAILPFDGSVLDPFCGSGTSLVAALKMQRPAIGIELEEKYCEIAAKRLDRELSQSDLFIRRTS